MNQNLSEREQKFIEDWEKNRCKFLGVGVLWFVSVISGSIALITFFEIFTSKHPISSSLPSIIGALIATILGTVPQFLLNEKRYKKLTGQKRFPYGEYEKKIGHRLTYFLPILLVIS